MTFESATYTSNVNQCLFFWGEILHHGNPKKNKNTKDIFAKNK
jgi:hypothetical protein